LVPTKSSHVETQNKKENDVRASKLQLDLAASIVGRLIERNGGRDAADRFWDDDSFEAIEDAGPGLDLDLSDPKEETLPEMAYIRHNIFECD